MDKKECISLLKETIMQLESFGYQWALDRAKDLTTVAEYIEDVTPEHVDVSKFINTQTGEVDVMGYTSAYLEKEQARAKRRYEKAYKKTVEARNAKLV